MLQCSERENRLFGISILKELIEQAEKLYKKYPNKELIETIDTFYRYIENYDINKTNTKST